MKKIIIAIIILMLASPVFALQEVAGPLIISAPIGGTGSGKFGLINDENETITVSLRAEGDVAKYLSFPATVDLETNKIVYTDIIAKVPADYDKSLGENITGYLYALQEGKPGAAQINIQMMKSVTILTSPVQTPSAPVQTSPPTGLFALIPSSYFAIILVVAVIVILFIIVKRRR